MNEAPNHGSEPGTDGNADPDAGGEDAADTNVGSEDAADREPDDSDAADDAADRDAVEHDATADDTDEDAGEQDTAAEDAGDEDTTDATNDEDALDRETGGTDRADWATADRAVADRDADDRRREPGADVDRRLAGRPDDARLRRMRTVAYLLDDSVPVPWTGYRVGIDPLLGVLPVSGDVVGAGLSLYIVAESARLGVSTPTLLRMVANVAIDFAGGSIPVVGTLFDAAWKANQRNLDLALDELSAEEPGKESVPAPR